MSEFEQQNQENILIRELGEQERLLHYVHRFGGLIGVQVMHLEGPVTPLIVRGALDELQAAHPMLQAHIKLSGLGMTPEMPWFFLRRDLCCIGTNPIPLEVIEDADPDDWHQEMQRQLNTPIKGQKMPRVRATLLRLKGTRRAKTSKNILMLASDHAIADAQAANMMTCQILDYLSRPERGPSPTTNKSLPSALEQLTPEKTRNKSAPYLSAIRLPIPFTKPKQRETRVVKAKLSVAKTKHINAVLTQNKTSMHGFLGASALKYLAAENGLDELTLLSNVEFRPLCDPPLPAQAFGCYIDIVRTKHNTDRSIWALAKDIKFRLITTLARNQRGASQLKMMPLKFYIKEGWAAIKSGMRLDAITVTTANAAQIKRKNGAVVLTDLTLAVSLNTIGANYFLISMERENALHLNLCFMHPGASDQQAQNLLDAITNNLSEI